MEFPPKEVKSKSKIYCCVYGCNSKASRNSELAFHSFPRIGQSVVEIEKKGGFKEKVDIRKAWEMKLKMGKPVTYSMKVCSLHFQRGDYFPHADKSKKKILKRNAVPSVNLPQKKFPTPEASKSRGNRLASRQKRRKIDFNLGCH